MPINRNILKSYAPLARREFIQAVTDRASALGLSQKKIEPVEVKGDVAMIAGRPFPKDVADRRQKLEAKIKLRGFTQVMEEVAYTWFNRFTALRYMELHDYLGHGYRVLSNPSGSDIPEILEKATSVDLPGLDKNKVAELRLAGDKDAELYRMLLVKQCNALHRVMPTLFEAVNDATELLLPENLLQTNSPIRKLVNDIPEENWNEIEIVGWLYQFYISEKKDQVIGKVVKSEDIPAATQLFTPNWIVKYMVQNTLGRKWLMTYPASAIKGKMEFYIEPAEQEPEVQAKLDAITPKDLNPEELTFMDPACGSGHILAEAYDLFKEIYLERGYRTRDIPRLILEKNLYGLDIDDRAAQLARFTLLMKARADDRRILDPETPAKLNIMAIQESKGLDVDEVARVLLRERVKEIGGKGTQQLSLIQPTASQASLSTPNTEKDKPDVTKEELYSLLHLFEDGKTFGSLLTVPNRLKDALPRLEKLVAKALQASDMESRRYAESLLPLVIQTKILSALYDYVVANPPYMGSQYFASTLKKGLKSKYKVTRTDLYAIFIERISGLAKSSAFISMITRQDWMHTVSYEHIREFMLDSKSLDSLVHLGKGTFESLSGEVVQSCVFSFLNSKVGASNITFWDCTEGQGEEKKTCLNNMERRYDLPADFFPDSLGRSLLYSLPERVMQAFQRGTPLNRLGDLREGIHTGDNGRFVRFWWEISLEKFTQKASSTIDIDRFNKKWIPYNKGGTSEKWYGGNHFVISYDKESRELMAELKGHVRPSQGLYFKEGGTWSDVATKGFGVRYYPNGFLFDGAGPVVVSEDIFFVLAVMNSSSFIRLCEIAMPNLHFKCGTLKKMPSPQNQKINTESVSDYARKSILIQRELYSQNETSFEMEAPYWLLKPEKNLAQSADNWHDRVRSLKNELAENQQSIDEEVDRAFGFKDVFSDANRLQSATKDVPYFIITCISYVIGCMMGRYSLDEPGLIYAHSGNEGFDPSRYTTFPADEDGIVPVMDDDWFEDDATNRFEEFLKVAWSPETLDENLKFVADSLEPKRGEAPIDTIRRFISQKFFKDHHLKVYKKRPIYWLFSSGKHKAFECLVYLHRYNENTLARMRAMYVTPLQGKYNARIEYLDKEKDNASSTSAANKLQKELAVMRKKQQELREFDELLRHYADQRISLDLDEGVKVNYGKFGSLLAYVKDVTGEKPE